MKKTFLIGCLTVLAMTAFVGGCKKDKDKTTTTEIPTSTFDGKITATVENGSAYNSLVKRVVAYFDESVRQLYAVGNYANGGFTLTLPNLEGNQNLWLLTTDDADLGGINISDKTAKTTVFDPEFYGLSSTSGSVQENDVVCGFYYYSEKEGAEANPVYADKNVTVTGSNGGNGWKEEYNVSLKKGWNWVYYRHYEENGKEMVTFTTQAVSGLKWYPSDYSHKAKKSQSRFSRLGFKK